MGILLCLILACYFLSPIIDSGTWHTDGDQYETDSIL